jgi:hypothetical protein
LTLRWEKSEDPFTELRKRGRRISRFPGAKTQNDRNPNHMSASKKTAKAVAHGKFKDLKAKKNPKGGVAMITDTSLNSALTQAITSSGKVPSVGTIVVTKDNNQASSKLFQNCT